MKKVFGVILGACLLFSSISLADQTDDEIQRLKKENELLKLKNEQEQLKKGSKKEITLEDIQKLQKPKSNKGWDFYGYLDILSFKFMNLDEYNGITYDFAFSIGPSYGFTEWFKLGARIGIGFEYFAASLEDKDSTLNKKFSAGATKVITSVSKATYTIPIAVDATFMLKPTLDLFVGLQGDFGGALSDIMVYGGINAFKYWNIRVGYMMYSYSSFSETFSSSYSSSKEHFKASGSGGFFISSGYVF